MFLSFSFSFFFLMGFFNLNELGICPTKPTFFPKKCEHLEGAVGDVVAGVELH